MDTDDIRDHWLTTTQAARAYNVSLRTLRRQLAAGQIDAIQIGREPGDDPKPGKAEWRIKPPPGYVPPPEDLADEPAPGRALAIAERMITPIIQERNRLQEELTTERAARMIDREELGRLRGKLEAIEDELARLRAADDAARVTRVEGGPLRRRRWPWERG